MHLRHLSLLDFKNIEEAHLDFSPKMNCLLGNNGMGKSNLLDAVYYLSFCKSFTGVTDSIVIRRGANAAVINAEYERRDATEHIDVGLIQGRRKSFKRSGKEYQRLSDHIGVIPLVMISPADMDLVNGPGEERRRFIDMIISQADKRYLDQLIRYNTALQQRNALLRDGAYDAGVMAAVETMMDMTADYIRRTRQAKVNELLEIFSRYYSAIAPDEGSVALGYAPSVPLSESLLDSLARNAERDRILRHTTVGPHRDDILLTLIDMPVRRTASQGQAKTFTIALRFAQYEFVKQNVNMAPILLLDDIFDKLDAKRVERIMEVVSRPDFGQIFITDTNRKHLDSIMERAAGDYRMWMVDGGSFSPMHT